VKQVDVAWVYGNDWEGLYIDGRLEFEGHSFPWELVMGKLVGTCVRSFSASSLDEDWLQDLGWLPADIGELVYG
jgi:hypothetical protein